MGVTDVVKGGQAATLEVQKGYTLWLWGDADVMDVIPKKLYDEDDGTLWGNWFEQQLKRPRPIEVKFFKGPRPAKPPTRVQKAAKVVADAAAAPVQQVIAVVKGPDGHPEGKPP